MRKEFVQYYYVKVLKKKGGLSCDAFSPVSSDKDDEKVRKAYNYYCENIPAKVANHLLELDCRMFYDDLVRIVHFFVLNLRDLGRVYSIIDSHQEKVDDGRLKARYVSWKRRILVEIIARSFRRVVDRALYRFTSRSKRTVQDSDIKKIISCLYNDVLWRNSANRARHEEIWKCILEWAGECFPNLKTAHNENVNLSHHDILMRGNHLETFLYVSSYLLGVKWSRILWDNRREVTYFKQSRNYPFDPSYIESVQPRVMELNMAYHSRGVVEYERAFRRQRNADAEEMQGSDSGRKKKYSGLSIEEAERVAGLFEKAVDCQPANQRSMDRLARSYDLLIEVLRKHQTPGDEETENRITMLAKKRVFG